MESLNRLIELHKMRDEGRTDLDEEIRGQECEFVAESPDLPARFIYSRGYHFYLMKNAGLIEIEKLPFFTDLNTELSMGDMDLCKEEK